MSKFKVGQRVAVYNNGCRTVGNIKQISSVFGISLDDGEMDWVSPEQCRRLIKKERRRIKVKFKCDGTDAPIVLWMSDFPKDETVEFIEVKK